MFSISTTPAKQSVSETITVLSGRLSSATLLEDRRAAILGLRSFSKDFPASVASGALRSLIGSLNKDSEDVDTVKVVLETLLSLFNPNVDSPEASTELFLWLADEFTQRQENITLLLDFVESNDFYSRLYSLQLISAILSARVQRTEECIYTAPLGLSRLVAVLDDTREAVRNECVSLLISLTPTSLGIQKLVAFESAFERVFAIINADGSLTEGGRTVEDCLILIANLLRRNASNQSLFRESDCFANLASLLEDLLNSRPPNADIAKWVQTQRERNVYAFLAVLRLFLSPGSPGILLNQQAFWKHRLVHNIVQLAFLRNEGQITIKAEALTACGDMIRDAKSLQESFAQLMVPAPLLADTSIDDSAKTYVIDGLLDMTLNTNEQTAFDLRYSACECLKAYFSNHTDIQLHFMSRAIEGYITEADESANVLTVLLRPDPTRSARDPYCQWFASVITFHLLNNNPTAKTKLLQVREGDANNGEEVVTSVQMITAHLITGITRGDDPRILVGYLMLLLCWIFEDPDAVNDILAEGSNVQSLVQAVVQPMVPGDNIVRGLCAMLLGVAYEFSTKDSPLSRTAFYSILTKGMDREQFLDHLTQLRGHPLMREFEVTSQKFRPSDNGTAPNVFFDAVFVNFFKDNYSRIARSLDRAPELEISIVTNGVQRGISRELVDSLRSQVEKKERAFQEINEKLTASEDALRRSEAEHQKLAAISAQELSRFQKTVEDAAAMHEKKLLNLVQQQNARDVEHQRQLGLAQGQIASRDSQLDDLARAQRAAESEVQRVRLRADAEIADLKASINRLEIDLIKANKSKTTEIERLREENASMMAVAMDRKEEAEKRAAGLEAQLREAKGEAKELQQRADHAEVALAEESTAKKVAQTELDDLLIVFGDLEEKIARYKRRLRELGEGVSEGEDDADDDEVD